MEEVEIVENTEKKSIVRNVKDAKIKQRSALHDLLSGDEEYANMGDFIMLSREDMDFLKEDVSEETGLTGLGNVMGVIYCDIQGYSLSAMANKLGLDKMDIQKIRNSAAFKAAKDSVMQEVLKLSRQMIEVSTIKAVKTLTECMNSRVDKVRLSAAVEVLNRTGLTATQKIELTTQNNNMQNFTDDQLQEILRSNKLLPEGDLDVEQITDNGTK